MKEYEVIWEIFNKCPRNQMRDVFVEEVEIADPEAYVKQKFQGKDVSYEKTVLEDGTIIFDIQTSMIRQRCSTKFASHAIPPLSSHIYLHFETLL